MNALQFHITTSLGETIALADFQGQVLLICNTASQCGFTAQYAALEAVHQRYKAAGLVIIGFPCNQFGQQEPGSEEEIRLFCQTHYDVSFLLSKKVNVKGAQAHPLWCYLSQEKRGVFGTAAIKWNFTKFLIGRDGRIFRRYSPLFSPEKMEADIVKLLAV